MRFLHRGKAIEIDGKTIKRVNETKSLGLQIDEHLTWARHVENISKKIASAIGALNSFSSAAEITRAISTWYFAGSYLRFSACYVDENNTIRFSEKFPIDTYNKMSTL